MTTRRKINKMMYAIIIIICVMSSWSIGENIINGEAWLGLICSIGWGVCIAKKSHMRVFKKYFNMDLFNILIAKISFILYPCLTAYAIHNDNIFAEGLGVLLFMSIIILPILWYRGIRFTFRGIW